MDDSGNNEQSSNSIGGASAERPPRTGVVFVSHEKTDQGLALEIRTHLEAGGFDCWMAPDDIRGPLPWPEQVERAIESCDVMLVVVSANSSESRHVSREVDLAVEKAKPLLPVRVEDVVPTGTLNYLLRLSQWIDLFPGSVADHAPALQGMVGSILGEHEAMPRVSPPVAKRKTTSVSTRRNLVIALGAMALIAVGIGVGTLLGGSDDQPDQATEEPGSATTVAQPATDEVASEISQPDPQQTTITVPVGKGTITLISVSPGGTQANDHSVNPAISADERYVAFDSLATNLVEDDTNEMRDVFVHDRQTGTTTRISQAPGGEEANGDSGQPRVSADGRYVVFASAASNLDPNAVDANGTNDIYLHDRETGQHRLVSWTPDGSQHTNHSLEPSMSDDASLIAYATYVDDRIPETPQAGLFTVWVHDLSSGTTTRLAEFFFSDPAVGVCTRSGPRVAAGGSIAVTDCGVMGAFLFDRASGTVGRVPFTEENGESRFLTPSPEGEQIYFSSAENWHLPGAGRDDVWHLYAYDRRTGQIRIISDLAKDWQLDIMTLSSNGRYLSVVASDADRTFNDVVIVDLSDESTTSLSREFGLILEVGTPAASGMVALSGDGRYAAFAGHSAEFRPGDTGSTQDVFVIRLLE